MTDQSDEQQDETITDPVSEEAVEHERREFLRSLGKWSQAVIGGVLLGDALTHSAPAQAWSNRGGVTIPLESIPPEGANWVNRGGGWYNRRPPGGWYNRRPPGGWYNRGGGWHNRGGGWHNRGGGWHNRGGGWYNRGGGYRRVPGWDDRS
jgi:hypothetical protein